MVDIRLCETEKDLEYARVYETLNFKIAYSKARIDTLTESIAKLKSMKTKEQAKLAGYIEETNKFLDKSWVVTDKGTLWTVTNKKG